MSRVFSSVVLIAITVLAPKLLAATSELSVRIDESGAVIVPVSIDGRGPFPFLLDTGSSHSVVSKSLADQLALRFVARTSVLTSTGREWRPVVSLDQTTIGGVQSEGLLASVTPSAQLDVVARGIEGVIGQDFLIGLNYTLDYQRRRVVWSDDVSDADGPCLPLVAQGGRYLVQVGSAGSDGPVLLVPDSGASGFVAYERNGRTRFALGSGGGMTSVHSLSGRQIERTMLIHELRLGAMMVRNQPVAVVARDPNDVMEGDGLLPLHLFASVSFNAREQCLVLRR
jgi:hypothetical protein